MRNYYAFNYPCGLAVSSTGGRYGSYHAFGSKHRRDEFVANGGDYATGPNYREAIRSDDPELRKALREAERLIENGAGEDQAMYEVNIITN